MMPRSSSRWLTVAAAGIGMSLGMPAMIFYTSGIFYNALAADIGLSRGAFGGGVLGATVALALAVPAIGWAVDRYGVRKVVFPGVAAIALGLALLGRFTSSPASFIALMTALGLLGAGASPVGYTRAVTATFDRARGTAMGVTLTIVGLGSALLPQLAAQAVARHGWRGGYYMLALAALVAIPVGALALRTGVPARPAPARPLPDEGGALVWRSGSFWLLLVAFTLLATALFGFLLHLAPLARDAGADALTAARYASLLGLSGLVSRLIVGVLADFVAPELLMAGCAFLAAAGVITVAAGSGLVAVAAVTLGFVIGAELDLMSVIVSRRYTGALYGRVYAAIYAPTIVGTGVSALWIGALADRFSYRLPLWIGGGAALFTGVLYLLLPRSHAMRVEDGPLGEGR